jgi:hypothetical protein
MHLTTQVLHLQLLCKATRIAKRFGIFNCDGICSIAFKAMALSGAMVLVSHMPLQDQFCNGLNIAK